MVRGVLAIRIYYDPIYMTPMADLRMNDGVIEHICWVNIKERKQFDPGINGYTLIYDERPKCQWNEWIPT